MDAVYKLRERQESMIPELEALEVSGVFSPEELKSIIKKRTDYEYLISSPMRKKVDFLRYLEYEMNLEELRRLRRRKQLSESAISHSDFAKDEEKFYSTKRIHTLFDRVTHSFPSDQNLITDWINYSKRIGSTNLLGKLFARFLALHPKWTELWIMAANWEFDNRLDITAARNLFQLGVRVNALSPKLWLEFFELELKYIQGFTRSTTVKTDVEKIEVSNLEDNAKLTEQEKLLKEHLVNSDILKGQIPKIVYEFATKQIPKDIDMRARFLDIACKYKHSELKQQIIADLLSEFPERKEVWTVIASTEYSLQSETQNRLSRIQHVVKIFDDFISSRANENDTEENEEEENADNNNSINKKGKKRKALYNEVPIGISIALVTFLRERLPEPNGKTAENYIYSVLSTIFEDTSIYDVNIDFALLWVDTLVIIGKHEDALSIASKLTDRIFANSVKLWESRLRLEIKVISLKAITSPLTKEDTKRVKGLFDTAFSKIDKTARVPLYTLYIQYQVVTKPTKDITSIFESLFEKVAIGTLDDKLEEVATFKVLLLDWAFSVGGLDCSRLVYTKCLTGTFSSFMSADFHRKAIEIEELQKTENLNYERIRNMYERALEITQRGIKEGTFRTNGNFVKTAKEKGLGKKAFGLWFGYMEFERRMGNLENANVIFRRATETLKDPKPFMILCKMKE
eukprot:TRINITY_DN4984_c1_g2_i2.p1 TRINITY_DN4984_c1_g2~~TRINITY_DN4984_c1_g2_i2.p1  ORF type:complete len:687 (+),score=134.23 TRINITY_DN4984_c1_g2_i2:1977-4037(+)